MKESAAFKLPEIDPAARPEFTDGPSCKAWLENVPLANVSTAQRQLDILEFEAVDKQRDCCLALAGLVGHLRFHPHW